MLGEVDGTSKKLLYTFMRPLGVFLAGLNVEYSMSCMCFRRLWRDLCFINVQLQKHGFHETNYGGQKHFLEVGGVFLGACCRSC